MADDELELGLKFELTIADRARGESLSKRALIKVESENDETTRPLGNAPGGPHGDLDLLANALHGHASTHALHGQDALDP